MARRPGLRSVPLSGVRKALERERTELRDVYLPLSETRFDLGETTGPLPERFRVYFDEDGRGTKAHRLTEHALWQLCSLSGVPMSFLDKLPTSLGLRVLRCMLEIGGPADGRPRLLRLKGEEETTVRAVLPASFVRLDDLDVLVEVDDAVRGERVMVVGLHVSDDIFHLRLVIREPLDLGANGRPDPAWPGVDLITSETGRHPLEVRHVVFRQVCTNGVTEISEQHRALRTRYTRFDRPELRKSLAGALDTAVDAGRRLAGTMRETRADAVADPRAEIERIFRTWRLGSPRGRIGRWVAEELTRSVDLFGCSRFDIVQAFTAVARGLDHRDRMKLEDAMGGYLLDPSRN